MAICRHSAPFPETLFSLQAVAIREPEVAIKVFYQGIRDRDGAIDALFPFLQTFDDDGPMGYVDVAAS